MGESLSGIFVNICWMGGRIVFPIKLNIFIHSSDVVLNFVRVRNTVNVGWRCESLFLYLASMSVTVILYSYYV